MPRLIAVNDRGWRIGEDHQRAKLTNRDVELIRQMREQDRLPYRKIAEIFEISNAAVFGICNHTRRNQAPARWKTVREAPRD
ncbi:hypothetical protein ASG35_03065 [Burkholderia sp. Leaf177]|uniref:hypothetical protein n=1 Tax=Burkholderia sp. Leaf177 TaxID=1736287 RepID=UPI0007017004|nr:hypothetical protein [Burkholderia sp. Leaf177]KQR90206.1 hypothetical protein ASG35_03065 [Burkholderia sp. Leaf177]